MKFEKLPFKQSVFRYLAIVGVFMVALAVLKVVEYFALGIAAANGGQVWVNALVYNLIVASWIALGIGVLYFLIWLLSEKVAVAVASILFGVLLLSEIGLTLYQAHNGFLLGSELVARPFDEVLLAIKGAMGVVLPMVIIVLVLCGFIAIAKWRAGHPTRATWIVAAVMVVLILLSLMFKMSHLVVKQFSDYILNKTHYLVTDCIDYFQHPAMTTVDYDEAMVTELLATHPEWGAPLDMQYPLERQTMVDSFLSPYFVELKGEAKQPHVVILLVESLGAELMGSGVVPFVDSLAATGLYWRNCLSATTRSYGAVPAITGSVGGPKSFQFGIMPDHNSLFSLLREGGYNTRAYYTGDFNFDCIYEYLAAQRVDYFSPIYEEFQTNPSRPSSNWWGYEDDTLFDYTLRNLRAFATQEPSTPYLTLVTTMSMHEEINLADKELQKRYEQKAERLRRRGTSDHLASLYPACLFTDDCLRKFMHEYRSLPGYENTIFIITGDHATGRTQGDKLSYHHVPLIIWSPLIKNAKRFDHIVTHNDVAPGIYGLLVSKYGLKAHETVHWLGDGLGPTPKTMLVVNYVHTIHDIIFHNHYYESEDSFTPEKLYSFGEDMVLTPCEDEAMLDSCRRQLALMKYLYSYTYLSNRLTAHPIGARKYRPVEHFQVDDAECVSPDEPSSETSSPGCTIFFTTQLKGCEGYSTVRLTMEADATVKGDLSFEQYPDIYVILKGETEQFYFNKLCKCYTEGQHVVVSKEFALNGGGDNSLQVSLMSPHTDEVFPKGSGLSLSNIWFTIEYGK